MSVKGYAGRRTMQGLSGITCFSRPKRFKDRHQGCEGLIIQEQCQLCVELVQVTPIVLGVYPQGHRCTDTGNAYDAVYQLQLGHWQMPMGVGERARHFIFALSIWSFEDPVNYGSDYCIDALLLRAVISQKLKSVPLSESIPLPSSTHALH